MKKNLLLITILLFTACNSLKEAGKVLRNEKTQTTDEFLVKKRKPLILPPDFDKIPKPGIKNEDISNEENQLKKILKAPNEEKMNKSKTRSIEESIINKIRK